MSASPSSDGEWFELVDHQNGHTFYANPETGECTWTRPTRGAIKPKDPNGEWWELYDDVHDRPYYYNSETKQTGWARPDTGTIIPLTGIQICLMKLSLVSHESEEPASLSSSNSVILADSQAATSPSRPQSSFSSFSALSSASFAASPSLKTPSSPPATGAASLVPGSRKSSPVALATGKRLSVSPRSPQLSLSAANSSNSPSFGHAKASLLSPSPLPLVPVESAKEPRSKTFLPESLKNDITQFMIDGFAAKYFATHKKGIFIRKKVPLEVMIRWTKDNLDNPLMVLNKSVRKEALRCFKQIQRTMGDRSFSGQKGAKPNDSEEIRYLLDAGINHGELRDEIYVQLCKQLSSNPSVDSIRLGWEIMCVICQTFPPSKNFEDYLKGFLDRHQQDGDEKVAKMAAYALKKLERTIRIGPRGKTPSVLEIQRAREAPFSTSLFGETLDDIMEAEKTLNPSATVPRILTFLTESILALEGERSEGIFRVPGDAESITELKIRLERGICDLGGIADSNVPASLLKLWLRELTDPLIPTSIYDSCIKNFDRPEHALAILDRLPTHHAAVSKYMIEFLQIIAHPDNEPYTKMSTSNLAMVFAPNFLRCPSDNPAIIFANTIFEQGFLRTLLLHYRKA